DEAHARSAEIADRLGPSDFNMPWINARADVIAADLIRGEYGRVEVAFPETFEDATNSLAWERWLVSGRLCSVRAELALAMKQPEEALTWARRALDMARASGRRKYEVIASMTLGSALTATGLAEDATTELRAALEEADALGSPLYRWQTRAALAGAVRAVEGVDAADTLMLEAATIIREVLAALSPERAATYAAAPQVAAVLSAVS
nr:hypothetical protein [Actinomycetota bacterium]